MADWWGNGSTGNNDWWGNNVSARNATGGAPPGTYNAKNLPLGDPNIAAENYGVTTDNAAQKFAKLWADRNTVDGGSKTIYDKMMQWSSPEAIAKRGGNPNDAQWTMMREALQTGKVDPHLNANTLRTGMGLGLSETARAQQHKHPFMQSWLGRLLQIPITVGGYYLGGPLGAGIANGLYQGVGNHDALAGLGGFASGYGMGSGYQWLNNGLKAGFGTLNNVNGFMPADIAARAGTTAIPQGATLGTAGRWAVRGARGLSQGLRDRDSGPPKP